MSPEIEKKIDKIFSICSRLDKSVGIVENNYKHLERQTNEHAGKIGAIEVVVQAFKEEKAKLNVVGRAALFVAGLTGTIFGGVIISVITYFLLR